MGSVVVEEFAGWHGLVFVGQVLRCFGESLLLHSVVGLLHSWGSRRCSWGTLIATANLGGGVIGGDSEVVVVPEQEGVESATDKGKPLSGGQDLLV